MMQIMQPLDRRLLFSSLTPLAYSTALDGVHWGPRIRRCQKSLTLTVNPPRLTFWIRVSLLPVQQHPASADASRELDHKHPSIYVIYLPPFLQHMPGTPIFPPSSCDSDSRKPSIDAMYPLNEDATYFVLLAIEVWR